MTDMPPPDYALVAAIQDGLPLVSRPFAVLAEQLNRTEAEVIEGIARLRTNGYIKRWGVVVRHRKLGYRANAMVVWDVPDDRIDELGQRIGQFEFITLCYQRPRRLPDWPYNLFCMIHGRDRETVCQQLEQLCDELNLQQLPHEVLFSQRCFKQRGARYGKRCAG